MTDKSRTLSPGRALRPEVRMNKEQEEALATGHHSAECKNCGAAATVELQFHQVSDSWQPYCSGCHDEMKATADEVNQHEMDRFGGAFGLVEWLVRELPKALPDRVSVAYTEAREWSGSHVTEDP